MSKQNIKQLIDALVTEVKSSELDSATIGQLRNFEQAIEPYLAQDESGHSDSTILDKANELEIAFAQKHPTAEGIVREIIDTLSRMGI